MADRLFEMIGTIAAAIVGLAIVATLVGQHAQTAAVVQASGQAFSSDIVAAEGPVLGS